MYVHVHVHVVGKSDLVGVRLNDICSIYMYMYVYVHVLMYDVHN